MRRRQCAGRVDGVDGLSFEVHVPPQPPNLLASDEQRIELPGSAARLRCHR